MKSEKGVAAMEPLRVARRADELAGVPDPWTEACAECGHTALEHHLEVAPPGPRECADEDCRCDGFAPTGAYVVPARGRHARRRSGRG